MITTLSSRLSARINLLWLIGQNVAAQVTVLMFLFVLKFVSWGVFADFDSSVKTAKIDCCHNFLK